MDKYEMMEQERRRYIAAAITGQDDDWAGWGDPVEELRNLAMLVMHRKQEEAIELISCLIGNAANRHVEKMDDLGRFDAPDIIADLKAAATDMQSLAESIRNVK